MKKYMKSFFIGLITISMTVVMLTGCNDDKKQENEKADIQDILPAATKETLTDSKTPMIEVSKLDSDENEVSEMDKMLPVFKGVGAYLCDTNEEYKPYSDRFYFPMITYVAESSKDLLKEGYTLGKDEEEGKIILSKSAIMNVSSATFISRMDGYMDEISDDFSDIFNEDNERQLYILNRPDLTGYTAQITETGKITSENIEIDEDIYEVNVDIKKNNNLVNKVKFQLEHNGLSETEDTPIFSFSIRNASIVRQ